jgi:hypothetical protein
MYISQLSFSITPARYKFLRQGISITGAGTTTFDDAVKSAQEIYSLFLRQFPDGKLGHWSPATHLGQPAFDLSNRYFTPKRDAPQMEHIPFTETEDPHGILEGMAKSGYIRGEDNKVQYFTCHVDDKGNPR